MCIANWWRRAPSLLRRFITSKMNILEFDDLSVSRGGKIIFDEISLSVGQGENTVILGPNGAGKSTLLKLLTRELYPLYVPGKTPIRIFGESVWDVRELRSRLGIVSNDFQNRFPAELSGADLVASGLFNTIGLGADSRLSARHRAIVADCMEGLGVGHLAKRSFGSCSTGEQRRLILARTLVNRPEALVLDEPTSGLDLRASIVYVKILRELMRAGTTVILVTHNLNEITPEISRAVLLKSGKILATGTPAKTLSSQSLSRLFDLPLRLSRSRGFYNVVPAE